MLLASPSVQASLPKVPALKERRRERAGALSLRSSSRSFNAAGGSKAQVRSASESCLITERTVYYRVASSRTGARSTCSLLPRASTLVFSL